MIFLSSNNNQAVSALWDRALAAKTLNDLPGAEHLLRELISLSPSHAAAHHLLGHIFYLGGHTQEALSCFRTAYELDARNRDHICDYGLLLMETGDQDRAVELFRRANSLFPSDPDILLYLGDALSANDEDSQIVEALATYAESLHLRPTHRQTLLNLAVLLESRNHHDEALACLQQALKFAQGDPLLTMNMGCVLQAMGDLDKAEVYFARALALAPDYGTAAWNLSQNRLLKGDFYGGWRLFESRFSKADPVIRRHQDIPPWRGEDLHGKTLLVWGEQAFGDIIQFCRFIRLLENPETFIYMESNAPVLDPLLASLESPTVKLWTSSECPPQVDYAAPLMSIPAILATTLETIPNSIPYLSPRADRVEVMEKHLGPRRNYRVGLVWAGRKQPDPRRSISLGSLAPLAGLAGIDWYSLQYDDHRREIEATENLLPLLDLADHITNFEDTAALICNLDLVIAIDTAVAHLAGALGKPVFLLLPFMPDWRWMVGRNDSPWYPTMRLFRQKEPGRWEGTIRELFGALEIFAQEKSSYDHSPHLRKQIKCYAYREGADFLLPPQHKGQPLTSVYEATENILLVPEPADADYFLFPYDLTPLQSCIGLNKTVTFLETLPYYGQNANRHVFYSSHDDPHPLPIPGIVFKASTSLHHQDDSTIPAPFLVEDYAGLLTFSPEEILYSTGFMGYPGSSPLREKLVLSVAAEKRLKAFFDLAPKFHGHLSPQEKSERQARYRTFLRTTLTILCPRGDGENSIRFFEALSMGRIPVLLADTCLLPAEGRIPYDDFILRISEREVEQAGKILHDWLASQPPHRLLERCRAARGAWESYFSLPGFGRHMVSVMRNKGIPKCG